ncbi:MAG: hypothetical protein H6Q29_724, partial [Bacteroidetes bacterium]|nr:hypothetical protein [Bacteroidota bacterium]
MLSCVHEGCVWIGKLRRPVQAGEPVGTCMAYDITPREDHACPLSRFVEIRVTGLCELRRGLCGEL